MSVSHSHGGSVAPYRATPGNFGWFTRAARVAFAAKGGLYLALAGVAVGVDVALSSVLTTLVIAALGIALLMAGAYKVIEAFAHPDVARGTSDATVTRVARCLTALLYVALAVAVFDHALRIPGPDEVHWTARLLDHPYGPELFTAAGLIAIGFGLHQMYRAGHTDCVRNVDHSSMSPILRRLTKPLGILAYAGRGVAFVVVGWFLIHTAGAYDPRTDPGGLPAAFEQVSHTMLGAWAVGAFAIGVSLYAIFCLLILARYYGPRSEAGLGRR